MSDSGHTIDPRARSWEENPYRQLRAECACGATVAAMGYAARRIVRLFRRWHEQHGEIVVEASDD